ncbi:MAG: recombinase family protein [Bacteroidales bacterium]|nr:recombinase family protein [Bacteroidales bacterium]
MNRTRKRPLSTQEAVVRCAIYTRKSTEEGLDQAFNSLDAQREAGEAYAKSQAGLGWELVPTRYDDGGFTGANTGRPALQRLLADITAGKIDVVIVYKVDRLSRSLLDFARLMAVFDDKGVSFVSVTQQFNTATSMGRLVLNVLLSFAQFEREIIAERTRDKIAATRRKGKWSGGYPALGYTVDARSQRLVIEPREAERVRAIFALYLEHGSLLPVVEELSRRGWRTKSWITRLGHHRGGRPFTRTGLHSLLTNVLYTGQVKYKDEVHPGEHAAIITSQTWQAVQARLARMGRVDRGRRKSQSLLQGVLVCGPCGCAMTPSFTSKRGRIYRYYVCSSAQKLGRSTCPTRSVSAGSVEAVVSEQIRSIGQNPALRAEVLATMEEQATQRIVAIEAEARTLDRERQAAHRAMRVASSRVRADVPDAEVLSQTTQAQERLAALTRQAEAIAERLRLAHAEILSAKDVDAALAHWESVWQTLSPTGQSRMIPLLIESVVYDGGAETLTVQFRPAGLQSLVHNRSIPAEGVSP